MQRSSWLGIGLAAWFIGECLAFAAVVHFAGVSGAILIGLATSLLGMAMLRRLGLAATASLRQVLSRREPEVSVLAGAGLLDGTLIALGSILLIVPGFLSDAIGLALAAPSIRQFIARRIARFRADPSGRRPPKSPQTIELTPQEWRHIDGRG